MIDIAALGEILIDFTPSGKNEHGIPLFAQNPGGAPANVLAMNAKLGGCSAFIGKVGQDAFGACLRTVLQKNAIDTRGLITDPEIPTTLAFVQLDETGERSFTFYRKPGADTRLTWEEIPTFLIDECRIFHFGAVSLTDEPARSATLKAAAYAAGRGKPVSFDPNYRPTLWTDSETARAQMERAIAIADILKVSEEEMQLLTGKSDPAVGADMLLARGPKAVFITMGAQGAYYANAAAKGFVPAFRVPTVDTTGAGDAFVGAMLWQLKAYTASEIATIALQEAVRFANAAGALTTTRSGAIPALPTRGEIQTYMGGCPA